MLSLLTQLWLIKCETLRFYIFLPRFIIDVYVIDQRALGMSMRVERASLEQVPL